MKSTQLRCKQHCKGQVREQTYFKAGQLVYCDHSPFSTSPSGSVAVKAFSWVVSRSLELYLVIITTCHTANTDHDEIQNKIFSDGASRALLPVICHRQKAKTTTKKISIMRHPPKEPIEAGFKSTQDLDEGIPPSKHTKDHFVKHISTCLSSNTSYDGTCEGHKTMR